MRRTITDVVRASVSATTLFVCVAIPAASVEAADATITCPAAVGSYRLSDEFDVPQAVIGQYSYSCYYRDPARSSTEVLTLHAMWNDYGLDDYCVIDPTAPAVWSGTRAAFAWWEVSAYDEVAPPAEAERAAEDLLDQFELAAGECSGSAEPNGEPAVIADAGAAAPGASRGAAPSVFPGSGSDNTARSIALVVAALIGVVAVVKLAGRKPKGPLRSREPTRPPAPMPLVETRVPALVSVGGSGSTVVEPPAPPPPPPGPAKGPGFIDDITHDLEHVMHDIRHPFDSRYDRPHRPCSRCGVEAGGNDHYCQNCGTWLAPENLDQVPEVRPPDPTAPEPPGMIETELHGLRHISHDIMHPFEDTPRRVCLRCGRPAPCLTRFCELCGTRLPDEAI